MNKKNIMGALALGAIAFFTGCGNEQPQGEAGADRPFFIGLGQLSSHTALDQSRIGFESRINEFAAETGILIEIDYQNAQGDVSVLPAIAQQFVNANVDLIHSIATSTTQAMAQETSEIPIVAGSISDYIGPGFAITNEEPGRNITGTNALMPIERHMGMILDFLPDAQTIGISFNSGEPNSVFQAGRATEYAEALGLTVIQATVTNVNDIPQVLSNLANQVDVLWIPPDNSFADAFDLVVQTSRDTNTPLFKADSVFTMRGAFAGLGIAWYELGRMAADQAIYILMGYGEPATMPIQFPEEFTYIVNAEAIEFFGLTVPAQYVAYIEYPEF